MCVHQCVFSRCGVPEAVKKCSTLVVSANSHFLLLSVLSSARARAKPRANTQHQNRCYTTHARLVIIHKCTRALRMMVQRQLCALKVLAVAPANDDDDQVHGKRARALATQKLHKSKLFIALLRNQFLSMFGAAADKLQRQSHESTCPTVLWHFCRKLVDQYVCMQMICVSVYAPSALAGCRVLLGVSVGLSDFATCLAVYEECLPQCQLSSATVAALPNR